MYFSKDKIGKIAYIYIYVYTHNFTLQTNISHGTFSEDVSDTLLTFLCISVITNNTPFHVFGIDFLDVSLPPGHLFVPNRGASNSREPTRVGPEPQTALCGFK